VDLGQINEDLLERDALFAESSYDAPPPASDLCGLSPDQVHELLQNPLNCPSVFKPLFNAEAVNQALDTAPVIRMAKVLIDAMGDKGYRNTWLTCSKPFHSCLLPPIPCPSRARKTK
jgi:hypothetical protein